MAKQKTGFTFSEHRALAAELRSIEDRLIDVACEIDKAHPVKWWTYDAAQRACNAVVTLQAVLDQSICCERHEEGYWPIYFGPAPSRAGEGLQ